MRPLLRLAGPVCFAAWVAARPALLQALPEEAPACLACHSNADTAPIPRLEEFDRFAHRTLSCAACHASEKIVSKFGLPADRVATFRDSFHGLAGRAKLKKLHR